jgi:hypothetical protein
MRLFLSKVYSMGSIRRAVGIRDESVQVRAKDSWMDEARIIVEDEVKQSSGPRDAVFVSR